MDLPVSPYPQATHHPAHVAIQLFLGLALRVVDGGKDQVLQHLDVFFRNHFGIDLEALDLFVAVDDDCHHAAARRGLDAQFGHLLLQALLRLLHHLIDVHSISSTFSISAGKTSSIAWTTLSAMAAVRRSAGLALWLSA